MNSPVKVGIIGCGNISPAYFRGCADYPGLELVACADLVPEAARARSAEFGSQALEVEQLLNHPDIELIINLTIPQAHAATNLRILEAGKHAYCEKPFGLNLKETARVLGTARERGLLVGCAPDTVLGEGIQTARKLLDDDVIGDPVGATAYLVGRGHEHWHPNPAFYYQKGGGPLLDMGPYYHTALVTLLGPAVSVAGMTKTSFRERTILSEPRKGETVKVEVATHLNGMISYANGVIANTLFSFDVFGGHHLPCIEIYGTTGTLTVPDPNGFSGNVTLRRRDEDAWESVPLTHAHGGTRSLGVADMARAIREGTDFRCNGALAHHILEIMLAYELSSSRREHVTLQTTCERPVAVPADTPRSRAPVWP